MVTVFSVVSPGPNNNITTTVLQPLYRSTCVNLEDLVGVKFYSPHALADSSQCIRIRERTLEFSSTVLSTLSPYRVCQEVDL